MDRLEEQLQGTCQVLERAHEILLKPEAVNLLGSAKVLEEAGEQLSRLRGDTAPSVRPREQVNPRLARRLRALAVRNAELTANLGRFLNLLTKMRSTQSGYGDGAAREDPARPHAPTISVVG